MVTIAGRPIGGDAPPWIVAELSGNHNGDLGRALALIEAAAAAGADAVKLQTYTADTITLDCDRPGFRIQGGPWHGRTLHELYRDAATPWDWHEPLFDRGRALGLTVFASPFDPSAVALLERLDAPAYKIASFELVDLPLIEVAARTGKPLILSTGLASDAEIDAAIAAACAAGCLTPILLHCVSGYPAPVGDVNLRAMVALAARSVAPVGLSDHTLGTAVAVAATALGAAMVEKHLTLSRADGGPDSGFSLEPPEFARLVADCRTAHAALGSSARARRPSEQGNAMFRRSLYVVADVAAGEVFTTENVRSIRPGLGLAPSRLPEVLGHPASRAIARGEPLNWSMVAEAEAEAVAPADQTSAS